VGSNPTPSAKTSFKYLISLVCKLVDIGYAQSNVQTQSESVGAVQSADSLMGEALDYELRALGLASPGAAVCSEIISRVFTRFAELARQRPLTVEEAEEISKRSL
jgi:hypothetical protein